MELTGRKVLVVGAGKSGIGSSALLYRCGACPILFDSNESAKAEDIAAKFEAGMEVAVYTGVLPEQVSAEVELVVLSPGVPVDTEFVEQFRKRNIPIWGEIELAYNYAKGKIVAITGTNGKTTTTTLVGQIMSDYYGDTFVVGNIGNPYTDAALQMTEASYTVAEISSFQLETIDRFRPQVSAILNITPDHLNRHHTMENYIAAKEEITKNQTADDICVLNYENEYTRAFGERCPARVVFFSSARELENGYFLQGETIYRAKDGNKEALLTIHDMNLVGMCNYENVMAAIAMTTGMGVPMEQILKTIRAFKAVEHRIEFVATKNGVDYYNDSKGTNPDAAIQGIRAMTKPTLLIGGGYDKQSEYDEWIEAFDGKVKYLILIGQTRDKIAACAKSHGYHNIIMAESLEEVMQICEEKALPGDAVLLSPACASWGMFPNYEVRGKMFKELVNRMK